MINHGHKCNTKLLSYECSALSPPYKHPTDVNTISCVALLVGEEVQRERNMYCCEYARGATETKSESDDNRSFTEQ